MWEIPLQPIIPAGGWPILKIIVPSRRHIQQILSAIADPAPWTAGPELVIALATNGDGQNPVRTAVQTSGTAPLHGHHAKHDLALEGVEAHRETGSEGEEPRRTHAQADSVGHTDGLHYTSSRLYFRVH